MKEKKLKNPVILFASIEHEYHDYLREKSHKTRRSIADLTRDAIRDYVEKDEGNKKS